MTPKPVFTVAATRLIVSQALSVLLILTFDIGQWEPFRQLLSQIQDGRFDDYLSRPPW
jgi:hypothetical protein